MAATFMKCGMSVSISFRFAKMRSLIAGRKTRRTTHARSFEQCPAGTKEGMNTKWRFTNAERYWYEFLDRGERIRESTKQGNKRVAEQLKA